MEMHQIRYFLAVSEYLNFRRAAEKCHVSAPALTRAIQKLEDEIGGKLFRRERNLTHLTDLGTLIRPHLKHILFEAEGAKNTAKGFLKLEHAPVKLGVMCTIGPIYFMGFLSDFQAKHPGVELTLIDGTAEKLNELLRNGWLDLAILAQLSSILTSRCSLRNWGSKFRWFIAGKEKTGSRAWWQPGSGDLSAGVFAGDTRRAQQTVDQAGSDP
jgi:DNA-binding transcriptional LysR family regulator